MTGQEAPRMQICAFSHRETDGEREKDEIIDWFSKLIFVWFKLEWSHGLWYELSEHFPLFILMTHPLRVWWLCSQAGNKLQPSTLPLHCTHCGFHNNCFSHIKFSSDRRPDANGARRCVLIDYYINGFHSSYKEGYNHRWDTELRRLKCLYSHIPA